MFTLLITCPYGLTSTLNQELKYLWYKPFDSYDTGTFLTTDLKGVQHINLRSRVASKVYLQLLAPTRCTTFDNLFSLTESIDRQKRLPSTAHISISVIANNSTLHAPKSMQSIAHKAVLQKLGNIENNREESETHEESFDIFLHLHDDRLSVYLNTSGRGLHERGYRKETGDAPLKENLAAALVLMSGRRRQQILRDPFCGSGTIAIEAAMIARNIAPWLHRNFAFQNFVWYNHGSFVALCKDAEAKSYPDKRYHIFCSDIDPDVLIKAERNAQRAGVADTIIFTQHDILDKEVAAPAQTQKTAWVALTILTNPPYGNRLQPENIKELYRILIGMTHDHYTHLACITTYPEFSHILKQQRSRKETTNGWEQCNIWMKPRN